MDILALAVWGAVLATPRTMHRWSDTEYTFDILMNEEGWLHPSISLVDMRKVGPLELKFDGPRCGGVEATCPGCKYCFVW